METDKNQRDREHNNEEELKRQKSNDTLESSEVKDDSTGQTEKDDRSAFERFLDIGGGLSTGGGGDA